MYITNAQMDALEKAINLLPDGSEKAKLDIETQCIIDNARNTLSELKILKRAKNKHIAEYIKERRKTDKSYAH